MVKRGGNRQKKRKRSSKKQPEESAGKQILKYMKNVFLLSPDSTMVVLGITQVALGLVLIALLANFFNPMFENPASGDTLESQGDRPFSAFILYGFLIFTFSLWTLLFSRRYKLGQRQTHFLTILYLPGTFMAAWIVYRYFAAVNMGN